MIFFSVYSGVGMVNFEIVPDKGKPITTRVSAGKALDKTMANPKNQVN